MAEHQPQGGGGDGPVDPSPDAGGGAGDQLPNADHGARKRRRRRSKSGRSGRRGRGESHSADAPAAEELSEPPIGGGAPAAQSPTEGSQRPPKKGKPQTPAGRGRKPRSTRPAKPDLVVERPRAEPPAGPEHRPDILPRTWKRERRPGALPQAAMSDASGMSSPSGPERLPERRPATRMQLTAAASRSPGHSVWIAVLLLTVVGLLARLPGLADGLWADEIYSVLESFRTQFPETLADFPGDNKHPLYALLAHTALSVFGEQAWVVRLPALLFGVATIPLLYTLGTRITSRAEALSAAALVALSYHHVWFSQNARGYAMLAFFAVLTTVLLLRACRADAYRPWIWYGLAAALGAYTHLTFVFTVVAQFLVVGLAALGWPRGERRIGWRGPLAGFALSAAVTVLFYLPMLPQVIAFFLHKESNLKGVSSPSWAIGEAFRVLRTGFGDAFGIGVVVLVLGAAVGVAGAVSYARRSLRTFLLLSVPALVTVLGAFGARGTMYPRFFFLLIGFALLIGMRGTFATGAWLARRLGWSEAGGYRLGASMAVLVVVISGMSVPRNWRLPKQDFLGAMAYVEREAIGGDVIAVTDVTAHIYGTFYQKSWPPILTVGDLVALRSVRHDSGATRAGRVWLVYTFPRYLERLDASLSQYVARECTGDRVRVFPGTVGGGEITVCRLERT